MIFTANILQRRHKYRDGYQIGFGESTLEEINEIRKKVGLYFQKSLDCHNTY